LVPPRPSPLPQAQYSITLNHNLVSEAPGSFSSAGALGSIVSLPNPSAHAQISGVAQSFEQMIYWFRVDGPTDGVHVPVVITGDVSIDVIGGVFAQNKIWGATAQLIGQSYKSQLLGGDQLEQNDYQVASVDCNPGAEGPIAMPPPIATCVATAQSVKVTLHLDAIVGADNRVILNAATNNQESAGASFDSLVDPIISFAPEFDPTGYSFLFSDGIGNEAPEPALGALVAAGLALLFGLRRSVHCADERLRDHPV